MHQISPKQHIVDLAHIIKERGIRHVVICPGSRNAPLIKVFHRDNHFICHSIVDERSAGYTALGMAKQTKTPVVIITTSGTATLNLSPAVAEAWYQHIPLIILTADRPKEFLPQINNQIIDQEEIFIRNSKKSCNLPLIVGDEAKLKSVLLDIDETVRAAISDRPGPVHLNIPLMEPLYDDLPELVSMELIADLQFNDEIYTHKDKLLKFKETFNNQKRILVIAGMDVYGSDELLLLKGLAEQFQAVVIAENIANLPSELFISNPDLTLGSLSEANKHEILPDLVVTFGGQVVSKQVKIFLQDLKDIHIEVMDRLPAEFFRELLNQNSAVKDNRFLAGWKKIESVTYRRAHDFLNRADFCNLTAIGKVLEAIPGKAIVHFGNSGSIRYSQLHPVRHDLRYYANRGTSGIDGSLSTAAGAAMVSEDLHVVILGDLSFIYDSNGMWNRDFPANLKVIVLNDGGGGIFRILDGPDRMPFFEDFSVTHHPVSIQLLSEAFGLETRIAKNFRELQSGLELLFDAGSGAIVLEVETSKSENSSIFKQFFKSIQNQ